MSCKYYNCSSLPSITIPESVTSIGVDAFLGCSKLTSVNIPNSVTSIGNYAFSSCISLTSVNIPISMTTIGNGVFQGCTNLASITIPNSVTSIGQHAFYCCSKLTSITIPNSVTSIGDCAFEECTSLASINIPICVTTIGYGVFQGCTSLTSITIPNSVTSIGDFAFNGCSSLTSVTIPESVTSINYYAFAYCSSLASIKVDACNPKYDSRNNCNAIIETESNTLITGCMNTIIPNSVTSIGDGSFVGCSSLTSVTIPESVTSINYYAFAYCSSLASIKVDACNPKYDSRNNCNAIIETESNTLITGCMNTIIPNSVTSIGGDSFTGCSGLTSVTIPESVTSIGGFAFFECSGLTSVTIPNSVTTIEYCAFNECSNLTSVTVGNPTPVNIDGDTFSNRANATLYVPTGSKSAYLAADYWKEFKEIIEKNMSHDAGLGDVNGDGEISIADVTLLVDYLLEQAGDNFILANADVNKDGKITVSDVVSIIKIIVEGNTEPQAYLTCPDDHHPHMIDLGLPSGTKWACCNVGADKPEEYGEYYAWGETEEKSYYDWSNYIHCDGSWDTCHDLGSDIAGTQYDVAHVKWGGSWVMPSNEQQKELVDNCTYTWTTMNGINGGQFTGPNGDTIFLPAAGNRKDGSLYGVDSAGYYWSSTQHPSYSGNAYYLTFDSGFTFLSYCSSYYGFTVRPVSSN